MRTILEDKQSNGQLKAATPLQNSEKQHPPDSGKPFVWNTKSLLNITQSNLEKYYKKQENNALTEKQQKSMK